MSAPARHGEQEGAEGGGTGGEGGWVSEGVGGRRVCIDGLVEGIGDN